MERKLKKNVSNLINMQLVLIHQAYTYNKLIFDLKKI